MQWQTLVPLLLVAAGFAGCIGYATENPTLLEQESGPWYAPPLEDALWDDPQRFPHPAYNWPTITHVPKDAPEWWQPVPARALPADIQGLEHRKSVGVAESGDGIAVFGSLLVSPGYISTPSEIFDISDPDDPVLLSTIAGGELRRQVNLIAYPDGRLVAVFASDAALISVYDITDPTDPGDIAFIQLPSGGHTTAVVPGTPIVYNANSVGSRIFPFHEIQGAQSIPQTEIYDLSDPEYPVLVQEWQNGYGCHAVSFHITAERQRAYCAGVDAVQIWDIAEPTAPEVISTFTMPHTHPLVPALPIPLTLAHNALVNRDASVLVVSDETGGGWFPMCDFHLQVADTTLSGPFANVWFFDIVDEREPRLLSWLSPGPALLDNPPPHGPPLRTGACTAHNGSMIPTPGRDLAAVTFFAGGVLLVDFTDPESPFIVDQWNPFGQPSDVWYHNGHLFAGDFDGGTYVFGLR